MKVGKHLLARLVFGASALLAAHIAFVFLKTAAASGGGQDFPIWLALGGCGAASTMLCLYTVVKPQTRRVRWLVLTWAFAIVLLSPGLFVLIASSMSPP